MRTIRILIRTQEKQKTASYTTTFYERTQFHGALPGFQLKPPLSGLYPQK